MESCMVPRMVLAPNDGLYLILIFNTPDCIERACRGHGYYHIHGSQKFVEEMIFLNLVTILI